MLYTMHLYKEPMNMIRLGLKKYELRLNDEKRQNIKKGDKIEFIDPKDERNRLTVSVKAVKHYPSFKELYDDLPLSEIGYNEKEAGSPRDMDIYYPQEKQEKYGVLAIKVAL
ncbi:MAG: ASCH domain-containing protein [Bacillales bacterium]|nr:ASCH domain-containing protein [Bacillales bacterium]